MLSEDPSDIRGSTSSVKYAQTKDPSKLRILLVGSGGREHALVWKLSQSERVDQIFVAPGK
jgi:shikimate 5-dehydrogenase